MCINTRMSTVSDRIEIELSTPKTVKVGDQEVTRRDLSELIQLEEHQAKKAFAANPFGCIGFMKLLPPGGG